MTTINQRGNRPRKPNRTRFGAAKTEVNLRNKGALFGGFPYSVDTTLTFSSTILINPIAPGEVGAYSFRSNSIYDPDSSGAGHQPMGHDQWAAIYAQYIVESADISATFLSADTTGDMVTCGLLQHDDGAVANFTVDEMVERGTSVITHVRDQINDRVTRPLKSHFDARSFFGVSNPRDVTYLSAYNGQNPSDPAFFIVWAGTSTGAGSSDAAVQCNVVIKYHVHFMQPLEIGSSLTMQKVVDSPENKPDKLKGLRNRIRIPDQIKLLGSDRSKLTNNNKQ